MARMMPNENFATMAETRAIAVKAIKGMVILCLKMFLSINWARHIYCRVLIFALSAYELRIYSYTYFQKARLSCIVKEEIIQEKQEEGLF